MVKHYTACWFILLGAAAVAITLSVFVPLQLGSFSRVLQPAVEQKVNRLMSGSLRVIASIREQAVAESFYLEKEVAKSDVTFSTPREGLDKLNSTFWRLVGPRVANSDESLTHTFIILSAEPAYNSTTKQMEGQAACSAICARPGDPQYFNLSVWAMQRLVMPSGESYFKYFYSKDDTTVVSNSNMSITSVAGEYPSWSRKSRSKLYIGTQYQTIDCGPTFRNGTFYNGRWSRVQIASTQLNEAYYYNPFGANSFISAQEPQCCIFAPSR